jgi:hypothetical protein
MIKTFEKFMMDNTKNSIIYKIPVKDLEDTYKFFHISITKLIDNKADKTFEFTAKAPRLPFQDDDGNVIEDNFTNRVSLGTSIKNCLYAMNDGDERSLYLYGVDLKNDSSDNINPLNLKTMLNSCPVINGEKYGTDFNLHDWIASLTNEQYSEIQSLLYDDLIKNTPNLKNSILSDEIDVQEFVYSPSSLPEKYKKLFYACVPDADDTNEFWSLKNLKMDYLGEFSSIHDAFINLQIKKDDETPNAIKNILKNKSVQQ